MGFSRGDPTLLLEDVRILKPTLFIAVPLICNRIYEQVCILKTFTFITSTCIILGFSASFLYSGSY